MSLPLLYRFRDAAATLPSLLMLLTLAIVGMQKSVKIATPIDDTPVQIALFTPEPAPVLVKPAPPIPPSPTPKIVPTLVKKPVEPSPEKSIKPAPTPPAHPTPKISAPVTSNKVDAEFSAEK
ncbi:MAG: hypothetical protein NWQ13_03345, partial [Glaciimonas sp.]|nr:hypothetical protein [Glaciimonas sp.]